MKPEDLARHLEAARDKLEPRWDDAREAHVHAGLPQRSRLHRRRRVGAAVAGLALVALVSSLALRRAPLVRVEPIADARFEVVEQSSTREAYRVQRGGVWFEVTPGRQVRVEADEVSVEVLGTRFLVERVDARVHVVVDHGVVRVTWRAQAHTLRPGEDAWFPPTETATSADPHSDANEGEPKASAPTPAAVPEVTHAPAKSPKTPRLRVAPAARADTWKTLAHAGEFEQAWAELQKSLPPRDEPAELLLAADVARLSHHPEQALAPLNRIVEQHLADPRAPLAAFTLGRVLLDDLGRPREAAAAFEQVRTLAPEMPSAEDALARQIEALFRAFSASTHRARGCAPFATSEGFRDVTAGAAAGRDGCRCDERRVPARGEQGAPPG
jgi:transmembrane sensor